MLCIYNLFYICSILKHLEKSKMKNLLLSIALLSGLSVSAQTDSTFKKSNKTFEYTLENGITTNQYYPVHRFEMPKPSLFDIKEELVLVSREYLVDKSKLKAEQIKRAEIKKDYESRGFAFKEVKIIDAKCYLVFVK